MKTRILPAARLSFALASAIAALLSAPSAHAVSNSWAANAAGNWADPASWTGGVDIPGSTTADSPDIATFSNLLTAARAVTVDATRYIGGITFGATNTSAFGYTLQTGTLQLNSGSIIQTTGAIGANTNTISSPIVISGTSAATATVTSGPTTAANGVIAISGSVTGSATATNTTTLTLNGTGTGANTISGAIGDGSGGGKMAVVKAGAGTWTLSGANTFTGGTTLSAGTVAISNAASFGTGSVSVSGASRINITAAISSTNDINVGSGLTLQLPQTAATSRTATFSGQLTGSNSITVAATGFNGANGTYAFTNSNNTFTGSVIMPSGTTGTATGNDFFTFNSIGDAGTFTFRKRGHMNVIAYTGTSAITFGTRQIALVSEFGNGLYDGGGTNPINSFRNNAANSAHTVTFNTNITPGAIHSAATFFFAGTNTGNNTLAGVISNPTSGGDLGIGKTDAGRWILTGANSYLGEAVVRNGTLSVNAIDVAANNQPLGKNAVVQLGHNADSGVLEFTGGTNSTTDKTIRIGGSVAAGTGAGSILNNGLGTLTFTAGNFNPTIASITGARTLTLGGSNTGANTIQGVIQNNATGGAVALTKANAGTWVLSGPNSYTGLTSISAGTLMNGSSTTFTNKGGLSMSSTGIFDLGGFNATFTTLASAATNTITNSSSSTAVSNATAVGTPGGAGVYVDALTFSTAGQTIAAAVTDGATRKTQLIINNANSGTDKGGITNTANGFSGGLVLANNGTGTRLRISSLITGTPFGTGPIIIGQASTDKAQILLDTVAGNTLANNIVINTALGTDVAGAFRVDTTGHTLSGTITANANAAFNVLGSVTASGKITGAGDLVKTGTGTLSLNNVTNDYLGNTIITTGAISLASKEALPGYSTNGRYSVASGATLAIQNTVPESDIGILLGTTNFLTGSNFGFDTTAGDRTVTGNLTDMAGGPLGIVKLGANTLTLSGTNTYTGATTVLAGALYLGSTSSLPNWNVNGGMLITSGGSLVIPNTVSEAEVTTLLGTTNIASGASLLFDTSLGDRTYTSAVTNSAQGLLNIGKIGTNTLTLAGTNTHTGNTTVTSGTLNITGSLTGLAASSNLAYGNTPGNTIVNISGSVNDYKNFTGANVAGSIAVMNQTGGSASTLGTNGNDTQWVAQNGGYGYLNITGGTFNTGRFDAVGATGGGAAVVYVGGTGTFNNNSGDWLILPRKEGVGQLTVGPGGSLVRTAAVTASLGITMDGSNAHGALNIAGGNVDTGVRPMNFGFGSAAFTGTRGFVNLAGGTLSVGSAIVQSNTNAGGQYFEHFNFVGGTLKSNAAMTWLPAASAVGHSITATLYGAVTNNNNANAAFNAQIGTSSNFTGGLTVDTNNFETIIAQALRVADGVGVTQADIGDVSLLSGNSGYIGAPAVVFSAPAAPGGVPASGYAVIDVGTGKVSGIVITNPGTYAASETPTITLSGGGGSIAPFSTSALATANASGGLTKTGSGTLTLIGVNTYTGMTTVNAGSLTISGAGTLSTSSGLTVGNGARFNYLPTTVGTNLVVSTLSLNNGSSIGLACDATTSNRVTASGAATVGTGAVVGINLAGTPALNTPYTVLAATSGLNTGSYVLLNPTDYLGTISASPTAVTVTTATATPLTVAYWKGGYTGFSGVWAVSNGLSGGSGLSNWTMDAAGTVNTPVVPGSGTDVFLSAAGAGAGDQNAMTLGANMVTNSLTVNDASSPNTNPVTLLGTDGATLTLAAASGTGITVNAGSGAVTLASNLALGSNQTWTNQNTNTLTVSGTVSGAFGLTKAGTGLVTLSGTNTYSGGTTVSAGTLLLGSARALGSGTLTLGGGNLDSSVANLVNGGNNVQVWNSDFAFVGTQNLNLGTGAVTLSADRAVTVDANTLTVGGAISGAFVLTKLGAGTLNLTNTVAGTVAVNTGVGPVALSPASTLTLTNAFTGTGTLNINPGNNNLSLNGDLSGFTGTINVAPPITSPGKLVTGSTSLLGAGTNVNIASGSTWFINGGTQTGITVNLAGTGNGEGYGALRADTATLDSTSSVVLQANSTIGGNTAGNIGTINAVISENGGPFSLTKVQANSIALGAANTYSGPTTVSAGSLILKNASALGSTAAGTTVANTARVELDNITVTGEAITVNGSGGNFFGALQGRSGTSVWTGNVTIGAAADTRIGAAAGASLEVSGIIDDGLEDNRIMYRPADSTATVIVSGANTYTGGTSLVGGPVVASSLNSVAGGTATSNFGAPATAANGMLIIGTGAAGGNLRYIGAGETTDRTVQIGANANPPVSGDTGGATIENNGTAGALSFSAPVFNSPTNAVTGTSPARTLTLQGSNGNANTISGIIQNNQIAGAPTAAVALTKAGSGTWILAGANTYTGATTVTGGTLQIDGSYAVTGSGTTSQLRVGNAASTNGTVIIGSGAGTVTFGGDGYTNAAQVGISGGTGALTINGGTVNLAGTTGTAATSLNIGVQVATAAGTGTVTVNNGILNVGQRILMGANSVSSSGTLTIAGGTINVGFNGTLGYTGNNPGMIQFGSGTGTLNLDGGTLKLYGFKSSTGAANINFNGGTLVALGSPVHFMGNNGANDAAPTAVGSYTTQVKVGGAIIDTNSFNITLPVNLVEDAVSVGGGLTKQGDGILTLTGVNTCTGATTVNGGTLLVNSPGSLAAASAVAVNNTSTLGGNGTVSGNVTVTAAGNLAPGASAAGTLAVGGALDISALAGGAGTLAYELNTMAGTSDKIVTGTLVIGSGAFGFNDFAFTNLGGLQAGTYKLITSAGLTGTLDPANLTGMIGSFIATLQLNGNDVELVVSSAYNSWAQIRGLTGLPGSSTDPAKSADPDNDGKNNLYEFAFDGNPLSGANEGKIVGKVATVGGNQVMTLTLPVRTGAAFSAESGDQLSALIDGIYYRIEGDKTLSPFADNITEVTTGDETAIQAGLPALSTGWTYRTFRTPGTVSTEAKAFLRAKISETP